MLGMQPVTELFGGEWPAREHATNRIPVLIGQLHAMVFHETLMQLNYMNDSQTVSSRTFFIVHVLNDITVVK